MTARASLLLSTKPLPAPPLGGGLATASAPPLRLPGEHFAAAFTFFTVGTLCLAFVAPELASGAFITPHVAAVVHLFTLGFISTSIFGALYQFLPVAVGAPIRSRRLAHATFALLVTGIPTFVVALAESVPRLVPVGGGMVALAFATFAANFVARSPSPRSAASPGGRSPERRSTWSSRWASLTGHPEERSDEGPPGEPGGSSAFGLGMTSAASDDVVVLDVRGLEPPEPMVRTLEALERLPRGKTLVQINVRLPQFLIPQLAARGFVHEVREQSPDLVRIFIRHATRPGE